ncbi:GNAT family N-acetyltransferase [Streptomyces syringium]|uniref:GNAT superfamily N-acetyltransferase n=1 Tax=Streptomyces syringium TaxID=76729 RepID=A0ABS4Y5E6_9ACTN|nr:GNAT family N-acetyltransferase [Streptomyces syringium]MBP2403662.1 GNAT superfamily N-acetyltransferase [Streptomyces syringium]
MSLTLVRDPQLTPALREELADLWLDVSQAGGAVGFVPPVTAEDIAPVMRRQLDDVTAGGTRMLGAYEGAEGDARGRLIGTAFLKLNSHHLMTHWCTLVTVMVHPALQGGGRGKAMMREAIEMARDLGFHAVRLGVRGGEGTERFYETVGFKEVGRVPAAIRVAPDDHRDDITMWLPLV